MLTLVSILGKLLFKYRRIEQYVRTQTIVPRRTSSNQHNQCKCRPLETYALNYWPQLAAFILETSDDSVWETLHRTFNHPGLFRYWSRHSCMICAMSNSITLSKLLWALYDKDRIDWSFYSLRLASRRYLNPETVFEDLLITGSRYWLSRMIKLAMDPAKSLLPVPDVLVFQPPSSI